MQKKYEEPQRKKRDIFQLKNLLLKILHLDYQVPKKYLQCGILRSVPLEGEFLSEFEEFVFDKRLLGFRKFRYDEVQ